jgi:hypothetical protein
VLRFERVAGNMIDKKKTEQICKSWNLLKKTKTLIRETPKQVADNKVGKT